MTRTSWLRRILVVLGLAVYSLCFAELFVRLLVPAYIMPRYVTGAPWGVRTNVAGAVYTHITPDVRVEYRINRWGMRSDTDYTLAKPAGRCRVELFGDSYAAGYELTLEQSYASRLEALLRARYGDVELLNFGVSGFGTAENLRAYEGIGHRFAPDLVLMQWQAGDYDDNVRSNLYRLDGDRLVRGADSYLPGVALQDRLMRLWPYRILTDHSFLYSFGREWLGWRGKQLFAALGRKKLAPEGDQMEDAGGFAINPAQVRLSSAIMLAAQDRVHADGAAFAIVDIPNRNPPKVFGTSIDLFPADARKQLVIASPIPGYQRAARRGGRLFFEHGARHLTPLGASLLAEATARRIEQAGLLEKCRPAAR